MPVRHEEVYAVFFWCDRVVDCDLHGFNRHQQKVYFVRDNGTGYSDAQAKRLFDAFQDNSLDAELPKDTISLANARRVISRHNGQIWAEGIEMLIAEVKKREVNTIHANVADISRRMPLETSTMDICLMTTVLHDLIEDNTDQGND